MKYFLIAGEASGDLHASNLMKAIIKADSRAEFRYMGGDLMEGVSPGLLLHYRETSFMFLEVLFHLRKIFRNMRKVKNEMKAWQPDALIPVDYPGFNLRMTRFAHRHGIPVHYYISPKVWAWKKNRITTLRTCTEQLYSILPFEVGFFRDHGMEVEYHGNPLVDSVREFLADFEGRQRWKASHGLGEQPLVALLAGSRRREIQRMLPVMVKASQRFPAFRFVVAGAPSVDPEFYRPFLEGTGVGIVHNETYGLLASSVAAMVTSGTATLETALFRVPQVVLYKTAPFAYAIAKRIVKVNFISLVNLILDRELVKEILQKDLQAASEAELSGILNDTNHRARIARGYEEIAKRLGDGHVSARIAGRMVQQIGQRQQS